MSGIFQPSNQIKLTNVAVVRLKKGGKRFELACYRNKVLEHRRGITRDLDDVLQIPNVFLNVSKGHVASKADLVKAFGTDDVDTVIAEILKKGEVQQGDKERALKQEEMWKEVVGIISEKCVDPGTKRAYTPTVIDKVLKEIGFSLHPTRSPKQQALEAIKVIQEKSTLPIARAQMRLRVVMPAKEAKRVKDTLLKAMGTIEEEEWGDELDVVCLVDPGQFRVLNELVQKESRGKGKVETLSLSEAVEDDEVFS